MNDVILHTFNWTYAQITKEIDKIANSGFGAILIAPPVYSDEKGSEWWQRYQPKDYRIILSYLGNKKELETLIKTCHKHGLKIFADVVINHMANEARKDRLTFPGKVLLSEYKTNPVFEKNKLYGNLDEMLFVSKDFNHEGNIENWEEVDDVVYGNLGDLPDLRDNTWVLQQQLELFRSLVAMGFDGFRLDAIKHVTEKIIDNICDSVFLKDKFMFGEVLTTNPDEEEIFMGKFLQETHIPGYDFPLHRLIRESFKLGGSLRNLLHPKRNGHWLPWERAITFVVNHDIPLNDTFRGLLLDPTDEHLAHAYMLGIAGGTPLIYCDHDESAKKFPEDKGRWSQVHTRADIVGMIKFRNAVRGKEVVSLVEQDNCIVFRRGEQGIVAINKSGEGVHVSFNTYGLMQGRNYSDVLHPYTLTLHDNPFWLFIPPRTAQMWLLDSY